ncbi:MAG: Serine/threonine-protein kinase PrkC, partial [Planctomycetota bacterium]
MTTSDSNQDSGDRLPQPDSMQNPYTEGPNKTQMPKDSAAGNDPLAGGDLLRSLPPRYQIEKRLGQGGMGAVFLATDRGEHGQGARQVAIKFLLDHLASRPDSYARFVREMHTAEQLEHENIVQVLYHGKTNGGAPYLVMQYIDGGSLLDRIRQKGRLEWSEAVEVGLQLCTALMVAHDRGVIHRDIKPGNVLIRQERYPRERVIAKLADFGLARSLELPQHSMSAQVGTFGYRSPEQRQGLEVDARSDVYGLGATLFHALTGEVPEGIVEWEELPEALRPLLRRAMAKRPGDRFGSAREMYESLEALVSSGQPSITPAVATKSESATPKVKEVQPEHESPIAKLVTLPENELPPAPAVSISSQVIEPVTEERSGHGWFGWLFPKVASAPEETIPKVKKEQQKAASPDPYPNTLPEKLTNSIGMKFRLIKPGTFRMGSPESESGRRGHEHHHQVTLTRPYYLGVYPVTQEEYERVMGSNPSYFKGKRHPVENVSWEDAMAFLSKLNTLASEKSLGGSYRLPTEAEWEYACRAGTTTAYSFGDSESELEKYGWYDENSGYTTHPVGEKLPNGWGLYDMHGNVWEWCADWYGAYP